MEVAFGLHVDLGAFDDTHGRSVGQRYGAAARKELPVWSGSPTFSEHSYRTFVGDRAAAEVLYMQNVGHDVAHMSLLGRDGRWQGVGELKWPWGGEYPKPQPLRLCYPNVIMRNRAAHFFGVGDIVEPIEEWREEKHRITGRDWDYVFRRLFYATTPDVSTQPFGAWVEIANFDATAGSTRNCDIWVAPDSSVHLLWGSRISTRGCGTGSFPARRSGTPWNTP